MSIIKNIAGTGIVIPNKYGDFIVLRSFTAPYYDNKDHKDNKRYFATIQFVNPNPYGFNTIRDVHTASIKYTDRPNSIRDPYQFDIANGSGCLGMVPYATNVYYKEYNVWHDMVRRCYNKEYKEYKRYGAKGVSVDLTWRCFEFFLYQLPYVQGYEEWKMNPSEYELDKDIKQMNTPVGERVYSVNTCCFISKKYNTIEKNFRLFEKRYFGVTPYRGHYRTIVNNTIVGRYYTAEAAAARYNNEMLKLDPNIPKELLNDVPYMSNAEIILKYQVR